METYTETTSFGDKVCIKLQHEQRANPNPTAVLAGWIGSSQRNLSKYGAIFQSMHFNTVQYIIPMSIMYAPNVQNLSRQHLESVLQILCANPRLTDGGLVFMYFSNGGAVSAPHLPRIFADSPVYTPVQKALSAVIFDSAPCYLHVQAIATSMNEGLQVPKYLRCIVYMLFLIYSALIRIGWGDFQNAFWDAFRTADYDVPELYVYSEMDALLDAGRLDALVQERRANGHDARMWRVQDAEHVMLLRKYPSEYTARISDLCLPAVTKTRELRGLAAWSCSRN